MAGLGIAYDGEEAPSTSRYAELVISATKDLGLTLILEPGRVIVGNAGTLVTRVTFIKDQGIKRFIIVDAGMNDLMRPGSLRVTPPGMVRLTENFDSDCRPCRTDLRVLRLHCEESRVARLPTRRSRGRHEHRRLWILVVFELQLQAACGRGTGEREQIRSHTTQRNL